MNDVEIVARSGTVLLEDPSWDSLVDEAGTPFQSRRFLLPWWRDTRIKSPGSQLLAVEVVDGLRTVGVCAFELSGGLLSFAGGQDVVDYMGPVSAEGREKEVAQALARWVLEGAEWSSARLGGLTPAEVTARELIEAVLCRVPTARVETYDQAPGIDGAPHGYLTLLNSKRRLDVLRKRNRLVEEVGEVRLEASTPGTLPEALDRLLVWKSAAGTATADFVEEYGRLLADLLGELALGGSGHVVELCAGDRRLASAIVLRHRTTTYLYNMAYDPALISDAAVGLAPGVVLVSYLVEQALDANCRFDFLKGAQDYKRRLGGVPRDLAAIIVER
ncbi:protein involved in cellulose biosynthesis (CelD) [Catenulispora acidiphila DSM 44928]|uniref:Protein involved in cellulose biosynthesis (CelD) n=1 Tax=Catenulispora acidiphila (strain DSM 44928 / JCM 14897 / NBRC 102108 / NRRL B-24433 / ID139908) TaxID=479433 RepID=C7QDA1_CATAD|nr:GNAT family N-acetyltransferase [Catenulispora acidiphila]ACU72694.1 protein involved in cellulose biosynthesis (CelD) [Catenulispora acidiphila DSM 44928]